MALVMCVFVESLHNVGIYSFCGLWQKGMVLITGYSTLVHSGKLKIFVNSCKCVYCISKFLIA